MLLYSMPPVAGTPGVVKGKADQQLVDSRSDARVAVHQELVSGRGMGLGGEGGGGLGGLYLRMLWQLYSMPRRRWWWQWR